MGFSEATRPRIDHEIRALIVRMSRESFLWGAIGVCGSSYEDTQLVVAALRSHLSATSAGFFALPPIP
jgi:hypothetical protein